MRDNGPGRSVVVAIGASYKHPRYVLDARRLTFLLPSIKSGTELLLIVECRFSIESFVAARPRPAVQARRLRRLKSPPAQFGTMDPKKILFSVPTLENTMPVLMAEPIGNRTCQYMHEDDWRQFEFIDGRFRDELAREIAAIDRIWQEQSVPLGEGMTAFRQVHLRELIPQPLDMATDVAAFEALFGVKATPMVLLSGEHALANVYAAA